MAVDFLAKERSHCERPAPSASVMEGAGGDGTVNNPRAAAARTTAAEKEAVMVRPSIIKRPVLLLAKPNIIFF